MFTFCLLIFIHGFCSTSSMDVNNTAFLNNTKMNLLADRNRPPYISKGCPNFSDLPTINKVTKKYIGARFYFGEGGPISSLACNSRNYADLEVGKLETNIYKSLPGFPGLDFIPMGTIFVHPGCSLYIFENEYFQGKMHAFKGEKSIYQTEDVLGVAGGFVNLLGCRSLSVECEMSYPECKPKDRWKRVAFMDNSNSTFTTSFRYNYQLGTEWSSEISHSFSKSSSVTATVTASFFSNFAASISSTFTTGYNWKDTDSYANQELQSITIDIEIPAGKIMQIDQAQGVCGNTILHTEWFRTIEIKSGEENVKENVKENAKETCKEGWTRDPATGNCYKVLKEHQRGWATSERLCKAEGAELASVKTSHEWEFIKDLLNKSGVNSSVFLGGTDAVTEGSWVWTDGSPVKFSDWHTGRPDRKAPERNCILALLKHSWTWYDTICNNGWYALCKIAA